MQDRLNDITIRPAFIYVNLILNMTKHIQALLGDLKLDDNILAVQVAFDSLCHTLQEPGDNPKHGVIPALIEYEKSRELPIGENKRKRFDEALDQVKKYQDEIDKIAKDHEDKLKKLSRERDSLVKNSNAEMWQKIISDNERVQKRRQDLMNLNEQRRALEAKQLEIEQKACCGRLGKTDKKRLAENLASQVRVQASIDAITGSGSNNIEDEKATKAKENLSHFHQHLKDKDNEIENEINKNKTRDKRLRHQLKKAKEAHKSIYEEILSSCMDFCKNLDRDTMFNLVHLRAKVDYFFAELKDGIDKMDKLSDSRKVLEQRAVLDAIQGKLINFADILNKKLEGIYCEQAGSKTGLKFYQDYQRLLKLHPEIKPQFEKPDYSPNILIDLIVPVGKPSRFPLTKSEKNDIHSFFPSVSHSASSSEESIKNISLVG